MKRILITRPRLQSDDFAAELRIAGFEPIFFPVIEIQPIANNIALVGSFSHWRRRDLKPDKDGLWKVTIPMLPNGKYYYKFIIDERMWVEDVDNPNREPDGVNGWNSVLMVEMEE